jgi:hypothetical protein
MTTKRFTTQNDLLLANMSSFYKNGHLDTMLEIINGNSKISLRIVDWFVTNFAKKNFTIYCLTKDNYTRRFKVYEDYKLKLKAYSKRRFDPFCRWDRIAFPYKDSYIQTTLGQLNFFKWAIENDIVEYIVKNYQDIEKDMNNRNSSSKKKDKEKDIDNKTRKKREELSISASKSIKKEDVKITVKFN